MKRAITLRRLKPGYYYSTKPVTVQGVATHVVVEQSDGKSFWTLRLENMAGWETTWQTKRGALDAAAQLIAGSLEPELLGV